MKGSTNELSPSDSRQLSEYQYRKLIPMTHEQYLDEPMETVRWMVSIKRAEDRAEEAANKKG